VGVWDGEVELQLDERGRLRDLNWLFSPDFPEARIAVETSIRRADSLKLLPPVQKIRGLRRGKIPLSFRFTADSTVNGGIALGQVDLPYIRLTQPVGIVEQPTPHWPDGANTHANVFVMLQYVVAEDGRVDRETVRVLGADSPPFVEPSIDAILGSRFKPGRSGPCPMKMLVRQRVAYRYGGGSW
jgi:hypothetical protein